MADAGVVRRQRYALLLEDHYAVLVLEGGCTKLVYDVLARPPDLLAALLDELLVLGEDQDRRSAVEHDVPYLRRNWSFCCGIFELRWIDCSEDSVLTALHSSVRLGMPCGRVV